MIRIESIISEFQEYTKGEIDCSPIQKAYILVTKSQPYLKLLSNSYLQKCLEVAQILIDLRLDIQSVVSGLLHDILLQGKISLDEIRDLLGHETASIVEGMHDILKVSDIPDTKERIAEKMRLIVFASSKDLRIIFVNLAARLVRMRYLSKLSIQQKKDIAEETLHTYAPIAERLGLSHIKTELEDLCFSFLHQKEFTEIQNFCHANELVHRAFLDRFRNEISDLLPQNGIEAQIKGRIKHYYSIFLKSHRIGIEFDQIHDLLGVRIIVKEKDDCYKALGLISSFYQPVTESFKDYIAFPKPNGYQSLHIDVYSKDGIGFDVQIRTREMDDVAELGIAAHWAYKDENSQDTSKNEGTSWLQDLSNSLNITSDPKESLDIFTRELYSEFVYVFTPKGKILKLQRGSCVIDFAYAIHTELGHTCVGAKINGKNSSIKTLLKHGDKVEVLTSSKQTPKTDWLTFVVTSRALSRIRNYLRKEERKDVENIGKELLAESLSKIGRKFRDVVKSAELKEYLDKAKFADLDVYCQQLGFGKVPVEDFLDFLEPARVQAKEIPKKQVRIGVPLSSRRTAVRVAGIENMLVKYANCCNPVKGDKIIGLVTQGQGVSIHLADCENITSKGYNPERLVDVEWVKSSSEKLPVSIHLRYRESIKTTLQIIKILANYKVVLMKSNIELVDQTSKHKLTIRVDNLDQLEKIITKCNNITSVKAYRSKEIEHSN